MLPSEEQRGHARVIVLSDGFWRRRFAGDPAAVGRTIDLDGAPVQVVGIMPRALHFPGAEADYWAPRVYNEPLFRSMRRPHWFRAVARLAPGVTLDQARADMTRIAGELEREYPDTNTQMGVGLGPLHEWFVGDNRRALLMLMGAVSLVLLIACTNVASLLLARATTRRRELAIRVALGAGRLRLLRQLFTESLVLAAGGAAAGAIVARWRGRLAAALGAGRCAAARAGGRRRMGAGRSSSSPRSRRRWCSDWRRRGRAFARRRRTRCRRAAAARQAAG